MKVLIKAITIVAIFTALVCEVTSQSCTRGDGWVPYNETTRFNLADNVVLVKILSFKNRKIESYGETYDVEVERICEVKLTSGLTLPLVFTISGMGARPSGCPNREVRHGFEYIIFMMGRDNPFPIQDVHQQQSVWEASDESFKIFPGLLNTCYTNTGCSIRPDDWHPMEIASRANLAEVIVQAKILNIHFRSSGTPGSDIYMAECELKCIIKQPSVIRPLPKKFNVSSLGSYAGICHEQHVTEGHEFIMFLERFYLLLPLPLPGVTVPPDLIENYRLGPDEVNQQQAIFNVTDNIVEELKDFTKDCPGSSSINRSTLINVFALIFISIWCARDI